MKNFFVFLILVMSMLACEKTQATQIFDDIQNAAEPLSYMSETDSPVNAVTASRRFNTVTEANFRRAFNIPYTTNVTTCNVDNWFNTQINHQLAWQDLQDVMYGNLTQRTCFKLNTVNVTYYVIGLAEDGRFYGVSTFAVET